MLGMLFHAFSTRRSRRKSAARSRGLVADLHLTDQQFATLLSILYVGYIIMQIPSNMFLNLTGKPSLYLPGCMIVWGMISALTGITTKYDAFFMSGKQLTAVICNSFTGAVITRFFLGFVEAAFFPGALFLISKWFVSNRSYQWTASQLIVYRYKRTEIGFRTAILYW
jgi:MFS family permease